MICPSCNSEATSFKRHTFTLEGATFVQSVKGQFTCQHCGVLLRITGYGKQFWYSYIPVVIALTMFLLFRKSLPIDPGVIWITLVIVIGIMLTFGIWRYAQVERVSIEKTSGAG
jgi:hypothetical protein